MADVKTLHLNDLMYVYFRDAVDELKEALRNLTEVSVDTGIADATSTVNQLDDVAKNWPVNAFVNLIVEITVGTGAGQLRKMNSNTTTALLPVTPFATAPDATSEYRIGFYGRMASDITHWGSTLLTGRDVSLDFKALTDDGIKGILKSLGDIGAGDNIATILAAIETAVEIIDDWDEANRAAVNLIAGQIGVQAGAGVLDALTQRVVAASDSPEVTAVESIDTKEGTTGEVADADGTRAGQLRYLADMLLSLDTKEGATGVAAALDGVRAAQLRYLADRLLSIDTKEGVTGEAADADGTRAGQLKYLADMLLSLDTKEGVTGAVAAADGVRSAQLHFIADELTVLSTKEGTTGEAAAADGTRAAQLRVIADSVDGIETVLGATDDAVVAAGAVGTLSAKLRAISRDLVANIVLATGANVIGGVTVADGSDATQGAVADTAGAAGATGTEASKLRRLTTDLNAVMLALQIIDDWDAPHGTAVTADGTRQMLEAKTFDGVALPNSVSEGENVRAAATEHGPQYVFLSNPDGSQSPYDMVNNVLQITETADARQQNETVEIQSATALTLTSDVFGGEINTVGFNTLKVSMDYVIGIAANHETYLDIAPLMLDTSGGDEQPYTEWTAANPKICSQPRFRMTANWKNYFVLDVAAFNYVKIMGYNDGTANWGTLQIGYTLSNNG